MSSLLKISQQTLWQVLGKIVTSLSTFIILGLVARNYGEAGTGAFTLALTYLAIFYLLTDFGFNAHILRKIRNPKFEIRNEWQRLLGTRIIWSVVLVVLAIGLLPFWPFATQEFSQAVVFGSLAIIASGVFVSCNLIFQSKLRYDLSVLASSVGTLASLAAFIYLVYEKFTIPMLLLGHLVGWFVIAVLSLFLVKIASSPASPDPRNDNKGSFPILDIPYAINLFKTSWPIAATLTLNVIYFRADAFMIAHFRSIAEVGIYNVAYALFQTALVLPTFIMNAYYPMMLRSFKGIQVVALGLLVVASIGTLFTISLAPLLIQLLTGGGFLGAITSLKILSLGFPAYFLSALLMWVMVSKGEYKKMLAIYAVGLVFNLGLNYLYIPQYSYIAASWSTVISEYLILGMLVMVLLSSMPRNGVRGKLRQGSI